jgi:hypothetical protein
MTVAQFDLTNPIAAKLKAPLASANVSQHCLQAIQAFSSNHRLVEDACSIICQTNADNSMLLASIY